MIGLIGLMGVGDDGTLYEPNGWRIYRVPMRLACLIQRVQHWVAQLTWR